MAAKCASPAPPLGEKHIFENQTVKLGTDPALPVDQALAEFEIENGRDYAARSAAARKAKLPDAAPSARP